MSRKKTSTEVLVQPLLIGPLNCEAAIGVGWRRVKDAARAAGLLPVRIGRTQCYLPAEIVAALRASEDEVDAISAARRAAHDVRVQAKDAADIVRKRLGLRRLTFDELAEAETEKPHV